MGMSNDRDSRDRRLAAVIACCSDRLNAGESLDVSETVELHPDLRPELEFALESLQDVSPIESTQESLETIGEYKILRELGRGGMGIVYEAVQTSMDRRVALKVLSSGLLASRSALTRSEREAKAAGRLRHENIVSVYGTGIHDNMPYIVMEIVDGETLAGIVERSREWPAPASDWSS